MIHFGALEMENNDAIAYDLIRVRGLKVDSGWCEANTMNFKTPVPVAADVIGSVYLCTAADGNFSSTDPKVEFDRDINVERTFRFDLTTTSVQYGLERHAGAIRIGPNGAVVHNSESIFLQVASGMDCYQFSDAIDGFLFRIPDAGGKGFVFWRNGTEIFRIAEVAGLTYSAGITSPFGITAGTTGVFTVNALGDVHARDLTIRGVITSGRTLAAMLDYLVTVFASGTTFALNFDTRCRYEITALTGDSTFTVSNVPAGNPSDVAREIRVQVLAGAGFKLTTVASEVEWDSQQGFALGSNQTLVLRTVAGKVRARWESAPRVALRVFANNAAAVTGLLAAGDLYRTNADPSVVCVVA